MSHRRDPHRWWIDIEMHVTKLVLKNWRNFQKVDIPIHEVTYVIGPNASGKSNLLDVFRFLRDISKTQGGGLQKAVAVRGGLSKLRCLHARSDTEVRIEVHFQDGEVRWEYALGFEFEGKGAQRVVVSEETVKRNNELILGRPLKPDLEDKTLLTQTHLEQIQANKTFRDIAAFLGEVTYLHLVPQLLKFGNQIGGQHLEDDPFGQEFLERLAKTPKKTRDSRLIKIREALKSAVPNFEDLEFDQDNVTGRPHLRARYKHHRPQGAWQREDQFSDGTLRLIALLWSLLEGNSFLLLEEPELSLNDAIVTQIPVIVDRLRRKSKNRSQVLLTTHSDALLRNRGIDPSDILVIEISDNGSRIRGPTDQERHAVNSGLSVAETMLPAARPKAAGQLTLAI